MSQIQLCEKAELESRCRARRGNACEERWCLPTLRPPIRHPSEFRNNSKFLKPDDLSEFSWNSRIDTVDLLGVGLGGLSMDDEILTIQEIAAFLKIKEKTAYDLAAKGRLPGFKVGGAWRFKRSALDQWIDEQTALAASAHGEDR